MRPFHEEDSPALTRCTSLSSLHIDGEVISTAKLSPLVHSGGRRAAQSEEPEDRKSSDAAACKSDSLDLETDNIPAARAPEQQFQSADLSEESEGSDDGLLEDIITKGRPSIRPPPHPSKQQASKSANQAPIPQSPSASATSKRSFVNIPKSASAHSLGRSNDLLPVGTGVIPPSVSTDCALAALAAGGAAAGASVAVAHWEVW